MTHSAVARYQQGRHAHHASKVLLSPLAEKDAEMFVWSALFIGSSMDLYDVLFAKMRHAVIAPTPSSAPAASRTGRPADRRLRPCSRWHEQAPSQRPRTELRCLGSPVAERGAEPVRDKARLHAAHEFKQGHVAERLTGAPTHEHKLALAGQASSSSTARCRQRDAMLLTGLHAVGRDGPDAAT